MSTVEASYRTVPPPRSLVDQAGAYECPDCLASVCVEEHSERDGEYHLKIEHDPACPWVSLKCRRSAAVEQAAT